MAKDYKFMVFRTYSEEERPNDNTSERVIFYGWTQDKSVLKAFLQQRTRGKYMFRKMYEEDIAYAFSEDVTDEATKIDFIELKFANSDEKMQLFMTATEMQEAEKAIQRMFKDMASTSKMCDNDTDDGRYLMMIMNLDEYYAEALYFLGFRPPEIDIICPSAGWADNITALDEVNYQIETAYNGSIDHPTEEYHHVVNPPGLSTLQDVYSKILYSVESFVKVMREAL